MNEIIISGKNSVLDAIENNLPITKLFLALGKKVDGFKGNVEYVDKFRLSKMTDTNHQGYVAFIKVPQLKTLEELVATNEPIIVLDHLQDAHNFGAIIRSANAFGFKNIVFPKDRAVQLTDAVIRVSSGGFVNMNFHRINSITATLENLKKSNYWIYASSLNERSQNLETVTMDRKSVIVVGNEAKGISRPVEKSSDVIIKIPMYGSVQSLNVSVASALIFNKLRIDIESLK